MKADKLVVNGREGVESLLDILLRLCEYLLQILRPLGQHPQHRGVLGREFLRLHLLPVEWLHRCRKLLPQRILAFPLLLGDSILCSLPDLTDFFHFRVLLIQLP